MSVTPEAEAAHRKQSVNGCVLCPRKWSDHTPEERGEAEAAHPEPEPLQALGRLIQRVERHVDFECGADHRYAFMEEVRVVAGDIFPPIASQDGEVAAALNVERLARAQHAVAHTTGPRQGERFKDCSHRQFFLDRAAKDAAAYARLAAPSAPSSGSPALDDEALDRVFAEMAQRGWLNIPDGHSPATIRDVFVEAAARLASQPDRSEPGE